MSDYDPIPTTAPPPTPEMPPARYGSVPVKLWPAVLFITATLTFLALMGAWTVAGASKAKVTWISGQPMHYAAFTRQPGRIDWERDAVIRLERGKRHLIVRQMDWCEGSGCQDLDLSHAGFDYLGSPSRGVMSLNWGCGRTGNLPKQRCLR